MQEARQSLPSGAGMAPDTFRIMQELVRLLMADWLEFRRRVQVLRHGVGPQVARLRQLRAEGIAGVIDASVPSDGAPPMLAEIRAICGRGRGRSRGGSNRRLVAAKVAL